VAAASRTVSRVPIPRAVIDADVLYRRHARNLLVWHAVAGIFELHWSARILDEARRHLIERNLSVFGEPRAAAVDRTLGRVTEALERSRAGSLVREAEIAAHEPHMPNDPKDRHVLAAAVAIGATVVITTNVRDFAVQDVAEIRVAPQTPDDFLTSLLNRSTVDAAMTALQEHARFHSWTVVELLALLAIAKPDRPAIAPNYVVRIKELTGRL
jgi:predicted nucleic acid-binding protein